MARLTLRVDSEHTQLGLQGKIVQSSSGSKREMLQGVVTLLRGLEGGTDAGVVNLTLGVGNGVAASGTLTIASNSAQSVTINGKTLTGGTDYVIATLSVTDIATNIVAAIKASTDSRLQAVKGSSVAGVVTITAQDPGAIGNMYTTTATGAASAGAATLASGADATQYQFNFNMI